MGVKGPKKNEILDVVEIVHPESTKIKRLPAKLAKAWKGTSPPIAEASRCSPAKVEIPAAAWKLTKERSTDNNPASKMVENDTGCTL
jgi:hypothetical protein